MLFQKLFLLKLSVDDISISIIFQNGEPMKFVLSRLIEARIRPEKFVLGTKLYRLFPFYTWINNYIAVKNCFLCKKQIAKYTIFLTFVQIFFPPI